MQSNRKNLGIFIIVIGLIILLLVIYFGFFRKSDTAVTPVDNEPAVGTPQLEEITTTPTTTPGDKIRDNQNYDLTKETPHQPNVNDLTKIAMAFSERFGSFSSQSDYSNFTDLKLLMTDNLKNWVDTYVAKIKSEKSSSAYYGITTKALTVDVKSFDDKAGTADMMVVTKRSESTQEINGGTPYNQNLELKFKKIDGDWLVDEVYWLK